MKRFLFMMLAVVAIVGCEKDSPINNDPNRSENPEDNKTKSLVWTLPAQLPDNIVDILIDTPCWKTTGFQYSAETKNGKVVADVESDMLVGSETNMTFKFSEKEFDYYYLTTSPNVTHSFHRKHNWTKNQILEYKDDKIVIALYDDPTVEGEINIVYTLK